MIEIPENTRPLDNVADGNASIRTTNAEPKYLTTLEAAAYMRKSRSWMVQRKDIPYYRGRPNLYLKEDLDRWLDTCRRSVPREVV